MEETNGNTKFVAFAKYCPICKWADKSPTGDPCNDCLAVGGRQETEKPINFEEEE